MPRLSSAEIDTILDDEADFTEKPNSGNGEDKKVDREEQRMAAARTFLTKPNQVKQEHADGDVLFRRNDVLSMLGTERLTSKHGASPSPEDLLIAAETALATSGREQAMEILSSF